MHGNFTLYFIIWIITICDEKNQAKYLSEIMCLIIVVIMNKKRIIN